MTVNLQICISRQKLTTCGFRNLMRQDISCSCFMSPIEVKRQMASSTGVQKIIEQSLVIYPDLATFNSDKRKNWVEKKDEITWSHPKYFFNRSTVASCAEKPGLFALEVMNAENKTDPLKFNMIFDRSKNQSIQHIELGIRLVPLLWWSKTKDDLQSVIWSVSWRLNELDHS